MVVIANWTVISRECILKSSRLCTLSFLQYNELWDSLLSFCFFFCTIRMHSSYRQMLLTHAHMWTRSISKKMAAGDGTHSKQHNFIELFLQSDYPSSFTAAGVHETVLLFMHITSLQSVDHFCVCTCVRACARVCVCVNITDTLTNVTSQNHDSKSPIWYTHRELQNTHTLSQAWQLGDSAGASIVPAESRREGYHGSVLSAQSQLSAV